MVSRPGPRVFFDTNVLFSGVYSASGAPRHLLDAATRGEFQAVASATVVNELVRNLTRKAPNALPYLERTFRRTQIEIADEAPASEQQRWYDAALGTDAPIVAAAVASGVDYFCTGDAALLGRARTGAFAELHILSPAGLLTALGHDAG